MPSAETFTVFAVAALALLVVPGPSVFYLVTQSAAHGRRRGMVAMFGIQTAGAVHVLAAAVGVSALVLSSAVAFSVVKYAGAAYLVWLGVQRLRQPLSLADLRDGAARPGSAWQVFRQGVVVNLLNPKSALFFVAVLPQFVDPDRGHAWLQVLALGAVFLLLATVSDGAWVVAAGWMAGRIRSRRARRIERGLSGGVLIALGVAAALQSRT